MQKWQYVISQRIADNERILAEKSKKLRNIELAELRKNNVIINIGDLRGQSLADILMNDLMINEVA